jgi:hypothetical protein
MMTGPQDPAAGDDGLRAGHADREQVIEVLKAAFTQGRLSREELDARTGQALAARTYAELATLTADVPAAGISADLAAAAPVRPPARVRHRRPLVRAVAGSGGCAVVAFAALRIFDVIETEPWTGTGPAPNHSLLLVLLVVAVAAVVAALLILGYGVGSSIEMRRSRRQLPLRPGPGGHALEAGSRADTGHDPVPCDRRTDQTRADLRAQNSSPDRPPSSGRAARVPRGRWPVPDAS